ncbi:SRPBCC domain-containing protein [Asticcacaulis sp. SL142]|uniref:SRPBCC family protein n=1 Tax=Asticcacaulis sp. SL142 TaxID=2995155 RepID=UPI00226CF7EA|nr:SRPBCC domain-containing protein [Asticcacaulis sp. SL142]WAC47980.1 SRPBCC domain-containing protein [Asticcacaulis sp. SL142]
MNDLELTVSRKIAAPRQEVFNAWLSPATLARFMKTAADGLDAVKVETDPVKGGRFSILMVTPEREVPHAGTYLDVTPYSRLSFTWESPHSLDDSVVTLEFAELESRLTEVTLTQVKFRSEEARLGHIKGWTAIIGYLESTLLDSPVA